MVEIKKVRCDGGKNARVVQRGRLVHGVAGGGGEGCGRREGGAVEPLALFSPPPIILEVGLPEAGFGLLREG